MIETTSDLELAWAAGFFDGEGSFYSNGQYPRVSIAQRDPIVLERFRAAVQVGKVYGPYRERYIWQYAANGSANVGHIYTVLGPYLSATKKEQFQQVWERNGRRR